MNKFIFPALLLILQSQVYTMDYYNFIIDGKKSGYYESEFKDNILYQNAYIEMEGEKYENPFYLKTINGNPAEYKIQENEWVPLSKFPKNAYPSCAFILLAKRLKDGESLEYSQINEGQNKITGKANIKRTGTRIDETVDGNPGRYVIINDENEIIEIGWGGPTKSIRTKDKKEAIRDTVYDK